MRFYVFTPTIDRSFATRSLGLNWPIPLILASASPRRLKLLQEAGIEIVPILPNVDDSLYCCGSMPAKEWVTTLAILKAQSVCDSNELTRGTVLSADTVCVVDGKILGQPEDEKMAREMVLSMLNRSHAVYTGWTLRTLDGGRCANGCETTTVKLGVVDSGELENYITSGLWQGKAGGYNLSERLTAGWPLAWSGDPTTVMGLPMDRLRVELSRK
jgi:septum formation protein